MQAQGAGDQEGPAASGESGGGEKKKGQGGAGLCAPRSTVRAPQFEKDASPSLGMLAATDSTLPEGVSYDAG